MKTHITRIITTDEEIMMMTTTMITIPDTEEGEGASLKTYFTLIN